MRKFMNREGRTMRGKVFRIVSGAICLALLLIAFSGITLEQPASADSDVAPLSRNVVSVTLDGGAPWTPSSNGDPVTVAPGASVEVAFTVEVTGSSTWAATRWRIDTGSWTCVDHNNHSSGTYTETFNITAPSTPNTYDLTVEAKSSNDCSSGSSGSITLTDAIVVGEPTTGNITIIKDTVPDDAQDFEFTGTGGLGSFTLDDDDNGTNSNTATFSGLTPGSYTVTETGASGWYLADIVCTGDDNIVIGDTGVTIDLDAGENVECTFVNNNNPDLEPACGIDVIFILDESGSIVGTGGASDISDEVRDSAHAFLNALEGTGSRVAIVEFNTEARNPIGYTQVTAANITNTFDPYLYDDPDSSPSNNYYDPEDYSCTSPQDCYTNWEAALKEVGSINTSSSVAPLVVFFTDGNPTAHLDNSGDPVIDGTSSSQIANALAEAIPEANAVKAQGSHIFVVGIPNDTVDEGNVQAVSGPDQYPDDTTDLGKADYNILSNINELTGALEDIVTELCGGTITVHKVIDQDGNTATTDDQTDGAGWTFTADVGSPGSATPGSGNTGSNGRINFDIDFGGESNSTVSIAETLDSDFSLVGASCSGATDNGTFDGTDTVDGIVVDSNDIAICTFYNRPHVDLELTKVVDNSSPAVGDQVTFTITVTNKGPNEATGVQVQDIDRSGPLNYVGYNASVGTYNPSTLVWDIGSLAKDASATLELTADVTGTGSFENIAEVIACDQYDIDSTPNNYPPDEDDSDSAGGNANPTAVTLSSFGAGSSAGGLARPLWLGLVGLTLVAAGSLFWARRRAGS
jgi:uncharacterized repeat protein (TIGR01451 family)